MQNDIKTLIRQIYFPPISQKENWSFEKFIGHDYVRYYSYARYALSDALKLCGVSPGDKVLLPGFICREVLASLQVIGAVPVYYEVTPELRIKSLESLPAAKAILIVNYFGIPANLDDISEYCSVNTTFVIEDNSHGFLSKDSRNKPLGTRADIGIFSLRKSMPTINGAALVVNDLNMQKNINKQLDYIDNSNEYKNQIFKKYIKKIIPKRNYSIIISLVGIKQNIFRFIKKNLTELSSSASESIVSRKENPHIDLKKYMKTIRVNDEINRRRFLFEHLVDYLDGEVDVIEALKKNTVPYVFPFRCRDIKTVKKKLKDIHLDCYQWPELPKKITTSCPDYYKDVWVVPFLW